MIPLFKSLFLIFMNFRDLFLLRIYERVMNSNKEKRLTEVSLQSIRKS
ncbi:hypothetical protein D2M30_0795 [Bacillus amyloliquefaciens]|nr:hypothetical protein D2M30_0795 [Bacillus amyloliquefaciens]